VTSPNVNRAADNRTGRTSDHTAADAADHAAPETGFLLHVFQRNQGGGTVLYGVGRLASGDTFAFIDGREAPYFYVRTGELDQIRPLAERAGAEIADTALTTMDGDPVMRVSHPRISPLRQLADELLKRDLRTYEADVNHPRHYLMARSLRGPITIGGAWRPGTGVRRVYMEPDLAPGDWEPDLAVLSLDIETDPAVTRVFAVSLVGFGAMDPVEEIHLVGDPAPGDPPTAVTYPDEAALLGALAERVRALDPDVLTGWNLVDFDLPVLQRRYKACGLPFNLGRSNDDSWYREGETWGGSRMVVYGRQVLDAMHLVRAMPDRYDDYRLDTIAHAVLGRGKTLEAGNDEDQAQVIFDAYRKDRAALCEYCLEDSRLVRDILVHEDLVQLSLHRSVLTGLPLERAWGSVAAFDFLYISELRRRGMVAPTTGVDRTGHAGSPGGLVMPARAGLYRHVFVFDFKSLYPSIIRTFNIDPLALVQAGGQNTGGVDAGVTDPGVITAPNGASFARDGGILPGILEELHTQRERAKEAGDLLASFAYKIVMNSFYGVLATDACRFARSELAGAITEFGQDILRWTKRLLESEGRGTVLYGDTDSLFVDAGLPREVPVAEALGRARELCEWVNGEVTRHIQQDYGLPSHLELEFEKYYRRYFLPPMRGGGDRGRAKGYAGLVVDEAGEKVEIVGMEAVRRDWTDLAHQVQRDLLDLLFHDAPGSQLEQRVTEWLDALRAGQCDEQLVYRKSLRKDVTRYGAASPPHVVAARLLPRPSGVIRYVMTVAGPQPLGHVSAALDYEHYVQKQIDPIVRTIAAVCDLAVDAVISGTPDLFQSRG